MVALLCKKTKFSFFSCYTLILWDNIMIDDEKLNNLRLFLVLILGNDKTAEK